MRGSNNVLNCTKMVNISHVLSVSYISQRIRINYVGTFTGLFAIKDLGYLLRPGDKIC